MDLKLFIATFFTVFVAEIGDKTQIAAFSSAAANKGQTSTILLAVVTALTLAGSIGVVAGKLVGEHIPAAVVKYLSGSLFVVLGLWILIKKA